MNDNQSTAAQAPQQIKTPDEELFRVLAENYECFRTCCRLGKFEDTVASIADSYGSDGEVFHSFRIQSDTGSLVPLREAVDNCYQLLGYLSTKPGAKEHGVLLLRFKIVIYEAEDYWLSVPSKLADELVERAESFKSSDLTTEPEDLNGGHFADIDERTRVVKDLIIAALFGANQLYRRHDASSYETARKVLTEICNYIDNELPAQHGVTRASYGLEGMAHYLRGRILSAQGSFKEARKEFRRSAEAYIARLRQKEEFVKLGKISSAVFEEKRAVTVRRAALVSAFGYGHISFVSSRITRALEILTLARAVLSRDCGRLYLLYVDVIYWCCRRAIYSSDKANLDLIIDNMTACTEEICALLPDSFYAHRTGLELALALYYRGRLAHQNDDLEAGERCCTRGVELLDKAIRFGKEHKNPHLHADALIIRSHLFRLGFRLHRTRVPSERVQAFVILHRALEDAEDAVGLSVHLPALASDAFMAQGAVETILAEFHAEFHGHDEGFRDQYNKAWASFNFALNHNEDENVRVAAEAHLRLTKLSLLDPRSEHFAYSHFKKWEEVRDGVEHEYCHEMARQVWSRIQKEGPILILRAEDVLDHHDIDNSLKNFRIDAMLFELVTQHAGRSYNYDDETWRELLKEALSSKLGYKKSHIFQMIKDKKLRLVERVKKMRGPLPED
jgi:tetratricopeptide (TPR) repeat protein